ncbi:hypothetical protein HQN87_16560 [Paenibacillus tritici]|uniref:Uncharacterized protein n=1 Tax=Paenibacillus tritici TaxID=1873425 RepID=A0ABX2DS03_9BACL|nr:hypothetical protein [Paenibacillus tritici]NQX46952.1 hypothetical protein [Paenibacillus tritici]
MSAELRINIQGVNPPVWTLGKQNDSYFSYYENEHGEQWVAKCEGVILRISGLDIGWKEYQLTIKEAEAEYSRILDQIIALTLMQAKSVPESLSQTYLETAVARLREYEGEMPLAQVVLEVSELLWLASVLNAAIPQMKWSKERN